VDQWAAWELEVVLTEVELTEVVLMEVVTELVKEWEGDRW